jgi:hypothetical protein
MFANRADDWFAEGWKERRKDDGRNKVAEEWMYLQYYLKHLLSWITRLNLSIVQHGI